MRSLTRPVRALGVLLAAAAATSAVAVVDAPSAQAGGNSLYFPSNQMADYIDVGAGAAIYIDGTITFDANCQGGTRPGIDDFVYPATDVYIVPTGSASDGSGLVDAGGGTPNTIVAVSSGIFISELIAVTTPSGSLGEGVYDVVYDTCQDGVVGFEDEIWTEAITVEIGDGALPPVDDSIRRIKDAAREEYAAWLKTHMGLTALFKYEDALAIAACILAPGIGCLGEVLSIIYDVDGVMAQSSDWIEEQSLNLVMNRAKNYGAIWQDPVDPDFEQHPAVVPEAVAPVAATGSPVADAMAAMGEPIAEEGGLADALLHALERYQGAQAAGDTEWALVQARAVADLSAALATHLRESTDVADLRNAVAENLDAYVDRSAEGAALINRIRNSGLTPDERQAMLNRGFDGDDIKALEAKFVADGRQLAPTAETALAPFDELLAARTEMAAALDESAAGWATLAAELANRVDAALPVADAGGPYTAAVDGAVALDAAGSATPDGTELTAIEWDTDGDGQYDDATGPNPTVTLDRSRTLAVRVTNDAGHQAVDVAVATVATAATPAATVSPAERALVLTAGDTQAFSADVPGAGSYRWTLDGEPAGEGPTFEFTATPDDVGTHVVSVVATNGRRQVAETWIVSVMLADADGDEWTASADCDDTRADVNPGLFERPNNGRDDDCDAHTSDAPLGGVTGEIWSWGEGLFVGRLPIQNAPAPVELTSLGQGRAVETSGQGSYAVLADGTVRSWGNAYDGRLGNGSLNPSYVPVVVRGVGTAAQLTNVVALAADDTTAVALRDDTSVVAWGSNANGQVGDGTDIAQKLQPVEVIDAATGQPLTGVVQVEEGESASYAIMSDGSVKNWGVDHCDGNVDNDVVRRATTNPRFGDDVVQIESGDGGGALVLTSDGTVMACVGYTSMLGRGTNNVPANEQHTPRLVAGLGRGSGVIDVAYGSSSMAVLKADGSVWVWGDNLNSSLDVIGAGPGEDIYVPTQVALPPGPPVVDIEMDYASTTHARRADGSVLVWGSNQWANAGIGTFGLITGTPEIALGGGVAIALANSTTSSMALVVPPTPGADPVLPMFWIDASVADAEIGESTGGTVAFGLSEAADHDVEIGYTFAGEDATVVVPAGQTSVAVAIGVADDADDEADEQLPIEITGVSGGVRTARHTGLVTVLDDDAAPALSVADVTVGEGNTSLTDVELTVTMSAASTNDVVVDVATVAGTAGHGTDVHQYTGSLLIPAGATEGVVHVSVAGDQVMEDDEAFGVVLSNPEHATLADPAAAVTVVDDEPIVVSVAAPAVTEGDAGTTPAVFTLSATQPPTPTAVSVPWTVVPGTAEDGTDVLVASSVLELGATPGQTTGTVEVAVVADETDEDLAIEAFKLGLGPVVAASGRPVVVGDTPIATIADDDDPVVPVVVEAGADVSGVEGSPVALSGAVSGAAGSAVAWSVADPACAVADPAALATAVTCNDETTTTVTLTVAGVADTAQVVVANANPTVALTAPAEGQQLAIGETVGAAVELGDPGVTDALACSIDWGDGSAPTPCDQPHAYAAAGARTIVVTVTDGDGGSAEASVAVSVLEPQAPVFDFDGFYAPVDNAPVLNVVKAGSTVPLKFGLGGDFGLDIFADGYPASGSRPCGTGTADSLEETVQPGAATLTYDPVSGRYHYNWKTLKSWAGTCRTLVLRFADGTEVTAEFRFK